ncbi:MAG: sugar phosphate isomerase/epimerase [Prochlorococcaceae cyanobacterium]
MRALILHSLWGFQGDLPEAIHQARQGGFDGVEANLDHPALAGTDPEEFVDEFGRTELALIVELVTGNGYVPDLAMTAAEHLQQLASQLERCRPLNPLRITVISGSDSWSSADQQWFWDRALELAAAAPAPVSFETHRSRSLADPWRIQAWLNRYPTLRLTADLSHWCVACERLMTPDLAPIQAIADRVDHIHARVGHAQGPQVSHPFAPEHAEALAAHRACWELFLERARARGKECVTLTPEFGPDGYLPTLPFTNQPVADLLEINTAMATWLRRNLTAAAPPGP